MIQRQTHLNVADNSEARELMCIGIIGARNRRYAHNHNAIVAVICRTGVFDKEPNGTNTLTTTIMRNLIVEETKLDG